MSDRESIVVCHLGRVAYEPTWRLQEQVQERLISAKRSSPPETVPHVLLLLEHPHVYTLGKSGEAEHLLVSDDGLDEIDARFHHIDRGGDITYHGPGQLVGYPLLDLDRFFTDLGHYLRTPETQNKRLKTLVAHLSVDTDILKEALEGKYCARLGSEPLFDTFKRL